MKIVGLRTYSVTTAEFPLEIEVTAFRLPVNRAIVGHPRVSRSGVLLERLVPEVVDDLANVAIRYQIPLPGPLLRPSTSPRRSIAGSPTTVRPMPSIRF